MTVRPTPRRSAACSTVSTKGAEPQANRISQEKVG
jgi:hypothetical protein